MKRLFTKIISVCFVIAIIATAMTTAFAAEELTINDDAKVNVGDKIKFTLYLSDCTEEIIGYEMRLFYDSEYLELDKESIVYENFDGVIYNADLENKIAMSWTNISKPADFSEKAQFLSVEFKVIKGGNTEISQFVTDMYGDDMTYLKSYKWTYDISVNDDTVVTDKTPLISDDSLTLAEKQGDFINYVDGMGEENSPNKDDHQSVTGVAKRVVTNTEIQNVTKDNSGTSETINFSTYFIIVAAVLVIVLAVVAVIVVKKRDDNPNVVSGELDVDVDNDSASDDIKTDNDEIID